MDAISRRGFVAAASAAGIVAGIGASGVWASEGGDAAEDVAAPSRYASWLGEEPVIDASQIEEEVQVDVIVIGAGVAGTCATRAAAEQGARVMVIEKADGPQSRSGEYAIVGGTLNERWGRPQIDPEDIISDHMDNTLNYSNRAIVKRWAYEAADVFDWFIASKPDLFICDESRQDIPAESADCYLIPQFWPEPAHATWDESDHPTYPVSVEFQPSQTLVVNACMAKAVADGDVDERYGYFAEKLVRDESGRVTGVYARNSQTGGYLLATGSRGVVLAAGDWGSNDAMYQYFRPDLYHKGVPEVWVNVDVEGNPTNTGDGYKMAAWIGAKIQEEQHSACNHQMGNTGFNDTMGITPFLFLDKRGRRFMNEDQDGQRLENQIELLKDGTCYQFFDSAWPEQVGWFAPSHAVVCYHETVEYDNLSRNKNYLTDAKLAAAVENGLVLKADTIEELLDQIDIDKSAALASIERYNELAYGGEDADFHKRATRLFPLQQGPFYCSTLSVDMTLCFFGGVVSDEEARAYDENLDVIPGLYVAGNMQGGRFPYSYPINVKGASHSMAMFYGYVAGKNAAAGL